MAENSKVFVSPGVYTAEKDLTFVAQSVGSNNFRGCWRN